MPPTYLTQILQQAGLGSLTQWAADQLVAGRSEDEIWLLLHDRAEFQTRFAGMIEREKKGLPPISVAEYLNYEDQGLQMMRAAGFPPSFYDHPDDFTKFIAQDVSLAELSQRVSLYQQAAYQVPMETRQQWKELYGIDEGGIAAYLADPNRALPILQQQEMATRIAGEAQRQRFGQLTTAEAERLGTLGVNDQSASQGFAAVAQADELFHQLPGEVNTAPGRSEALGLVSGDAGAQQAVDLAARRRKAPFSGGGGYATTQQGATGLGSAAR